MDNTGWEKFERFHKSILKEYPQEKKGVKAAIEISEFARKNGLNVPVNSPFNFRFTTNMHYDWLIRANKILKIISKIPNYLPRVKRLFNSEDIFDSLTVLYELEVALRFKIHGLDVTFSVEEPPEKTSDIEVKISNQIFNVEVTTLNNPDEVRDKMDFLMFLHQIMLKHKVYIAGNIINIPRTESIILLNEVEEKAIKSKTKMKKAIYTESGKLILEIVPRERTSELSFQGIHIVYKELTEIEDKINWTITKKQDQLNVNNKPGILCIYAGNRIINIEELYSRKYDKIYPYLQTYSNISGLVVSSYSLFESTENLEHLKRYHDNKLLREAKTGFGDSEHSIIWVNSTAKTRLPIQFIESYENVIIR